MRSQAEEQLAKIMAKAHPERAGKPGIAPVPRDLPKLRAGDIHLGELDTGGPLGLSMQQLVAGRMLVQGASGAGKSWTLRRLLEETAGQIQQIVVDPEGEFRAFAVLKRGLIGVYHHTSKKHLGRYVDEFAFRLNEGNVNRHTMERLDSFVTGVAGKRITYKQLIH